MRTLKIQPQPDEATCGPTCLHAVYRYYDDPIPLARVIREVPSLETGGTLAVYLACHALKRGYRATIYTYNLQLFDPTWFALPLVLLDEKLMHQARAKRSHTLRLATLAYLEYLRLGGRVRFEDLTASLIVRHLRQGVPILTGLSATYLYGCARERSAGPQRSVFDDLAGEPAGHFVVLSKYKRQHRTVRIADPYKENPAFKASYYNVDVAKLINSIMLGILTYDANLLVLEQGRGQL